MRPSAVCHKNRARPDHEVGEHSMATDTNTTPADTPPPTVICFRVGAQQEHRKVC
jgi:hypothetical protein